MASVELTRARKTYAGGRTAVADVSLEIHDGELLVLVGPSGSGKSTLLRLVAGLETLTAGRISIGGADVTNTPPQERDLAMVFQSYALYPHKTVRENLMFGLRMRRVGAAEIAARVSRAADALGIAPLLESYPAQLSGGERQRVAVGRAIVREPKAFLLDEPLSNLDPRLRASTRAELALLHRHLAATMIYVTHDQEEALTLGTRIAVMRGGAVEQLGAPMDVYRRPGNTFVAQFVGTPAMNLLPSSVVPADAGGPGVTLGIRPHDIELVTPSGADASGRVEVVEPLGSSTLLHVRLDGASELVRVATAADAGGVLGARIGLQLRRDRLHRFDSSSGERMA